MTAKIRILPKTAAIGVAALLATIPVRVNAQQNSDQARRIGGSDLGGVVAGAVGTDRPVRFIPMLNAARSPTFYEFDSADLLALYREMDDRDEEPVDLPLAHGDRGVPLADRHRAGPGTGRPLRARLDPRTGLGGVPLVPDPGRRGDRGGG